MPDIVEDTDCLIFAWRSDLLKGWEGPPESVGRDPGIAVRVPGDRGKRSSGSGRGDFYRKRIGNRRWGIKGRAIDQLVFPLQSRPGFGRDHIAIYGAQFSGGTAAPGTTGPVCGLCSPLCPVSVTDKRLALRPLPYFQANCDASRPATVYRLDGENIAIARVQFPRDFQRTNLAPAFDGLDRNAIDKDFGLVICRDPEPRRYRLSAQANGALKVERLHVFCHAVPDPFVRQGLSRDRRVHIDSRRASVPERNIEMCFSLGIGDSGSPPAFAVHIGDKHQSGGGLAFHRGCRRNRHNPPLPHRCLIRPDNQMR